MRINNPATTSTLQPQQEILTTCNARPQKSWLIHAENKQSTIIRICRRMQIYLIQQSNKPTQASS